MLVTTVTTAASFFANLVSPIQAVADFGLFMGLTVLMNFVIVMTWCVHIFLRKIGAFITQGDYPLFGIAGPQSVFRVARRICVAQS